MRLNRWLNQSLPQTLQIATFLFYFNAGWSVLTGAIVFLPTLVLAIGSLFAGLGIANEHKWGYKLGVVIASLGLVPFIYLVVDRGASHLFDPYVLLSLIFPVALFALVVHPESRNYQRIWFN